ncbi:hypothetical protein PV08_00162 [Exophiala spinifera]|uniref:Protein kinase domain-containing protein n=1 Tax=Exophiala spinifera TaxID=91928 RepID=A0A0D2C7Q6_9EURO|nr:uncharacterized protein PV08_00162 [Exophiala spinifera]KIW19589.1 hypothetical protein PV08_00162 [Exophiala spinifera]
MRASHIVHYLYLNGTTVKEEIIGVGAASIVVNRGGYAFKIPRIPMLLEIDEQPVREKLSNPDDDEWNEVAVAITSLQHEKAIYKRLGDHPGIIRCYNVDSEEPSIQMPLMNGNLWQHLLEVRPERSRQLSWLLQLAHTMAFVHSRRVIICDLRLDNIVYDDDMNIKLVDFSDSSRMDSQWDLKGCDKSGFSILSDIGRFGVVMFEIVTGQHCSFDIYEDWHGVGPPTTWPRREKLPSTSEVWMGSIIEKCWTMGFASAQDLEGELEKEVPNI